MDMAEKQIPLPKWYLYVKRTEVVNYEKEKAKCSTNDMHIKFTFQWSMEYYTGLNCCSRDEIVCP